MNKYQHILVAIDFTASTADVLQRAIELGKQNEAQLTLIHSVECTETIYTGDLVAPMDTGLCEELTTQAKSRMEEIVSTNHLSGTDTLVAEGVPKIEILRTAKELNIDLIVLGSHGRHGWQLLLGSTANGVLHQAECDVLAVRVRDA